MGNESYGMHYILDLFGCTIECKKDMRRRMEAFCIQLCQQIGMERGPIYFWDYADDSDKNYENAQDHLQGVSLVQFIWTSSIVIHHRHRQKRVNIEVFSCKTFEPMVVLREALTFFGGGVVQEQTLERF